MYSLDCDLCRHCVWLSCLSTANRDGSGDITRTRRVRNKVEQRNPHRITFLVNCICGSEDVSSIRVEIENLGRIRRAECFGHDQSRVVYRSNCPLMEGGLIGRRGWVGKTALVPQIKMMITAQR